MNLAEPIALERRAGYLVLDGYRPEYARQANRLARAGFEREAVADFFEIPVGTLDAWCEQHPELTEALEDGIASADDDVTTALYRRAIGYDHASVRVSHRHGRTTLTEYSVHVPADVAACMFWLKHRRPDEWGEREQVRMDAPS